MSMVSIRKAQLQPQAQQSQGSGLAAVMAARLNGKGTSTAYLVLSGPQAQVAQRASSGAGQSDVLAPHHVDQGRDGAALHEGCVVLRLERKGLQGPCCGRLLLGRACRRQHTRAVSTVRCPARACFSQARHIAWHGVCILQLVAGLVSGQHANVIVVSPHAPILQFSEYQSAHRLATQPTVMQDAQLHWAACVNG